MQLGLHELIFMVIDQLIHPRKPTLIYLIRSSYCVIVNWVFQIHFGIISLLTRLTSE